MAASDARPINNDMLDPELTKLSVDRVEFTRMRDAVSLLAFLCNVTLFAVRGFLPCCIVLLPNKLY